MNLKEELKKVGFVMKRAVGGGGNRGALARELNWCVEKPRSMDAKRQSLLQAAGQLGSEAVKLFVVVEFVKLFGLLTKRNSLFSRPEGLCRVKTIDNCFARGESSRVNAVNYGYERQREPQSCAMGVTLSALCRGVQIYKNTNRATECAMTNIGANFLKPPVDRAKSLSLFYFILQKSIKQGWAYQPNNET